MVRRMLAKEAMQFHDWRHAAVFLLAIILGAGAVIYVLGPGAVRMAQRHSRQPEQIEQKLREPAQ